MPTRPAVSAGEPVDITIYPGEGEVVRELDRSVVVAFDRALSTQRTLDLEDGAHEYAIYLFPYYLEKIRPGSADVIGSIWKLCEKHDSLEAIDEALSGAFDRTLKDFSVVNLDYEPYEDRYPQPLDLWGYHYVFKWRLDSATDMEIEVQHASPERAT